MSIRRAVHRNLLPANRRATTALEYALITSMIGVVITMAIEMTGHRLGRVFDAIATNL